LLRSVTVRLTSAVLAWTSTTASMSREPQEGVDEPVVDDPAQHHRVPEQDEMQPESEERLDDVHRHVESASHGGTVGRRSDNVKLSQAKRPEFSRRRATASTVVQTRP